MNTIDTDKFSKTLRDRAVRPDAKELLVSVLSGSSQEEDLTEPCNCEGLGRIRHFRRATSDGWPENPLPIDPAAARLGLVPSEAERAQVFQNSACNWRCWYCYVPFSLLSASEGKSRWVTADELVRLYLAVGDRPLIIDLSGGQPDLTPEWVPWMMGALEAAGISNEVYLWSDDNLSNDYFWRHLSASEIGKVTSYRNYGKVGCFKGFDQVSFAFNTRAEPGIFDRQFELFARTVQLGLDAYGYATFTTAEDCQIDRRMAAFVDRLQSISRMLPLRVVPLEVREFGPARVEGRIGAQQERAMELQQIAIACWNAELASRFSDSERALRIHEVAL